MSFHELELLKLVGKESQGKRTDLLSTVDKKCIPHNTQKTIGFCVVHCGQNKTQHNMQKITILPLSDFEHYNHLLNIDDLSFRTNSGQRLFMLWPTFYHIKHWLFFHFCQKNTIITLSWINK